MLISLVHAGGKHEAASHIFAESEAHITDATLRKRLAWVKSVASPAQKHTRRRHSPQRNCRRPSRP
jgi:hypothetical protein